MLKHISKPIPHYITSAEQLEKYQKNALLFLKTHYQMPKTTPSITMFSSGTTGEAKKYQYSIPERFNIGKYHWEKICYLNNLKKDSKIITLRCGEKQTLSGPHKFDDLNNNVFIQDYNSETFSTIKWLEIFQHWIISSPDLIYLSPLDFNAIFISTNGDLPKIPCPVLFSGETLFDDIDKKALKIFTKTIDKMRCWDGGLSFIECKYGIKHIDDELCLAENKDREILSTDFFNYATPYIQHHTDDIGTIKIKQCSCGIFGRTFEEFIGRSAQCLYRRDGAIIDPRYICNTIPGIIRKCGIIQSSPYRIKQARNGTITLFIPKIGSNAAKKIVDFLNNITGCYAGFQINENTGIKTSDREKLLLVYSEIAPQDRFSFFESPVNIG